MVYSQLDNFCSAHRESCIHGVSHRRTQGGGQVMFDFGSVVFCVFVLILSKMVFFMGDR